MRIERVPLATLAIPAFLLACSGGTDCDLSNPLMPTSCAADQAPPEPHLVFGSNRDWIELGYSLDDRLDVYTMNSDGSDPRRLTTTGLTLFPRWSPDGNRIAYMEFDDSTFARAQIYVMAADGSDRRNLSNHATARDGGPAWSPDGTRIAFYSNRDNPGGGPSIYGMNADGTNVVRLSSYGTWFDVFPDWSPDGTRIAFSSTRSGGVQQIFVMNADGTDLRQLTTEGVNSRPRWSPDGRKISFMSLRGDMGTGMGSGNGIYLINPDGTGEMNLTQSPAMDMFSTWSSDGRQVYFCNTRFTAMGISVFSFADGTVRNLTDPTRFDAMPDARRNRGTTLSGPGM